MSNHPYHSFFLQIPATRHWFAGIAITSRIEINYDTSPGCRGQRRMAQARLGFHGVALPRFAPVYRTTPTKLLRMDEGLST
jgi:hypothetical protein